MPCGLLSGSEQGGMRTLPHPFVNLAREALNYALPPRCPGCGIIVEGDYRFCLTCWEGMEFLGEPCCNRCGIPFAYDMGGGALCGACINDPPGVDRIRAVLAYGDVARTVTLKLKYGRRIGLGTLIARQMVQHLPQDERSNAIIIPVPLHRWRLWWRGFNQSAVIGDRLAALTGIDIDKEVLIRSKRTPPLRSMNPKARQRAVRGAFELKEKARPRLSGRDIVLIDDIYTSGSTADACALALRKAGVRSVQLLCWARVLPDLDNGAD